MRDNVGYIQIGTSHDTSEFACDSIRYWWNTYGKQRYPLADSILLLCDGGGSNSSRHYIFKQDLQALVNELGISIRIAHYPPYTSKHNPIEHRLFPHLTRVCQGVIFDSVQTVQELMATATTRTGLNVFTTILDKTYQTGRKVALDFKSTMKIVFDEFLPQWNYTAQPELQVI
ncbi:MAG: ISAzo13 family transposase ISMme1 [Chroococcidiopsis cubana SAG 39.79]|nr:ISAzo13 family transposase [Chroococcidiopsis cubana]MDZ4871067.1 ISAzo13 family transposase ISMme1 [Chroococcidiopsis cubana SAG 39.79]